MTSKFYAVKKGRVIGIFTNWTACQTQINGFVVAQYKSFTNKVQAQAYLDNGSHEIIKTNNDTYEAIAYTDGSFNKSKNQFSYGLVFITKDKKMTYYEKFTDENWVKMRNVAGEIMGSQKAMQIALMNNIKSLLICHDYAGISKWCTGEWKTNKIETKAYKQFYDKIALNVTINFKWIKSHSGDKLNDEADALATKAFSLPNISQVIS